jgi:hypothetical protein
LEAWPWSTCIGLWLSSALTVSAWIVGTTSQGAAAWEYFVLSVKRHFGVKIAQLHRPRWATGKDATSRELAK